MKEKKKFDKMREEYTNTKMQLEATKQQVEVKNLKIEKLEGDCTTLKKQLQEQKEKVNNLE